MMTVRTFDNNVYSPSLSMTFLGESDPEVAGGDRRK